MPVAASPRLASQLPDPGRLWIRHFPRAWPGPAGEWTDLALAAPGVGDPRVPARVERSLDDLLYLPPVASEAAEERLATARRHLAGGTPVLIQLFPGDPPPPNGATPVYDLLPALLEGDVPALASLPPGSAAVWPLVAGLTDGEELCRRGLEGLASAGVETVQGLALTLSPASRRRLAVGRDEAAYHALFHRPPPSERRFARIAHGFGLAPFLQRPLPAPPLAGAGNRRLAGGLLLAAELWLRLERPASRGLALGRAARWIDASPYEVEALAREGNLAVVEEVDAETRGLLERWVGCGRLELVEELLAEYLEAESEGTNGSPGMGDGDGASGR